VGLAQLPLSFGLRDDATFASFYAVENAEAKNCIMRMAEGNGEQFAYLYGSAGVGKTHLLHAACHVAYEYGQSAMYLPIAKYSTLSTQDLSDLASINLICLDDVDSISGLANWEEALFHLYNRIRDSGSRLIVSADSVPQQLKINLLDLKSRLAWGVTYHLQQLADEQKLQALQLRAKFRGINLTDAVSSFLLKHCQRDMSQLFTILDILDRSSIAQKRKITIPFVKTVLGI